MLMHDDLVQARPPDREEGGGIRISSGYADLYPGCFDQGPKKGYQVSLTSVVARIYTIDEDPEAFFQSLEVQDFPEDVLELGPHPKIILLVVFSEPQVPFLGLPLNILIENRLKIYPMFWP
jgi:hypothetical protein